MRKLPPPPTRISSSSWRQYEGVSALLTSSRGPDERLATFADPLRAQSVIDRFVDSAYDLVIDGESYCKRQKPGRTRPGSRGKTNSSRRRGPPGHARETRQSPESCRGVRSGRSRNRGRRRRRGKCPVEFAKLGSSKLLPAPSQMP